jgi:hypothetical protein
MTTERSDKVHSNWRESTEKFDYFILGIIAALCAFIGQGYKAAKLGINPNSLELIALLILVLAAIAGFRRIEQTLFVNLINYRVLQANEARGGMVAKLPEGRTILNEATGQTYTPNQAMQRISKLTESIQSFEPQMDMAKKAALRQYNLRNYLTLIGFLMLLGSRVWAAYA